MVVVRSGAMKAIRMGVNERVDMLYTFSSDFVKIPFRSFIE